MNDKSLTNDTLLGMAKMRHNVLLSICLYFLGGTSSVTPLVNYLIWYA